MENQCRKCIHEDVCGLMTIEENCKYFKNKERFYELPCTVGETVYEVSKELVLESDDCVGCYGYPDYCYNCSKCNYEYMITEKKFHTMEIIAHYKSLFGSTLFTNKEDAEKRIEEFKERVESEIN